MTRWSPCKRRDFVKRVQKLGFEGPISGTRHQFMIYQHHRLTIPSNNEYSVPQLRMMLKELEAIVGRKLSVEEWNRLK